METILNTLKKYVILISILFSLIFIFVLKVIGITQLFTFIFIALSVTLSLIYYLNTRNESRIFWTKYYWVLLAFPIIFFIIGIALFELGFRNNNSSEAETIALTPEECLPIYNQYNNTLIDITANEFIGSAAITIENDTCRATVNYIFQFSAEIDPLIDETNGIESTMGYMVSHHIGESRANWNGSGEIGVANQNIGTLPTDRYTRNAYEYYNNQESSVTIGSEFYHIYSRSNLFIGQESLDAVLAQKYYALIDGRKYIVTEDLGDGFSSTSLDSGRAVVSAPIVKEFELQFTVVQR